MAERIITVELPAGIETPALTDLLSNVAPNLIIAFWRELAADQVDTGDYLARLTLQEALRYPYTGDPDAVAVVNTAFHADFLERGRAGFHLPSRWGARGGRWRMGEEGPYARVAFRSYSPLRPGGGASTGRARGVMPAAVYAKARRLEQHQRLTGFGGTYKQSKSYVFYGNAFADFPANLREVQGYTWAASRFEGLFQAGMRSTPGGGTQSEYLTIRTITPNSEGWYIPPTPAHYYGERALEMALPQVRDLADRAAAQDIEASVVQAAGGLLT